ncbi:MAG: hypothetical protein OXN27_16015 [Candidatus Poribacteria bacterium]|nr:hypothetical protein [Candidatus Poribacteria bacterium]
MSHKISCKIAKLTPMVRLQTEPTGHGDLPIADSRRKPTAIK